MIIRFVKGIIKLILYLAFVAAAVYYTPRVLSEVLDTPYPLATITSGSMWPELKVNDLILMKGIKGADAEIGQIIIFQNEKGFTIHKLIRREKDGRLVTKGIANNIEDTPITEEQVIGRAVYIKDKPFRIPKLGYIARNIGPKIQEITE